MTQARQKRSRPSALYILTCFLAVSAVVRVASDIGPAFANEDTAEAVEMPDQPVAAQGNATQTESLFTALLAREARAKEREDELQQRFAALREAEAEIDLKLSALADAEARLRATIALADTAAETDLAQLRTVYENMKPKDAADLFAQMPPRFAAGFLGVMRPDAAAAIMSELDPEIAFSFSVVLAGRNADVPVE